MKYVQVKKLPKDCNLIIEYPFPFKFSGDKLYIYEPGVNCWKDDELNIMSVLLDNFFGNGYINKTYEVF